MNSEKENMISGKLYNEPKCLKSFLVKQNQHSLSNPRSDAITVTILRSERISIRIIIL